MKNKKALIVVSFGTSYKDTLKKTIEVCETELSRAFPDYELRRVFTSNIIIKKLKREKGIYIDTPVLAIEKLILDNFTEVLIQPLLIIPGSEYNSKILDKLLPFKSSFKSFNIGEPLLYDQTDYDKVIDGLDFQFHEIKKDEAVVLMGHGSDHPANSIYSCLQTIINDRKLPWHIACVEAYPKINLILARLKDKNIRKIHIFPLMLVAGEHARKDMASDEEDSWKSILQRAGYKVECYMKGLGENSAIRTLFIQKCKKALAGNIKHYADLGVPARVGVEK